MKANPSKFQAICLSKENVSIDFEIGSHVIKSDTTVKLLGVNFDNKLNFHNHVSLICKKAARQINALQRLCKNLDYTSKLRIYESFVASNFVYCSTVYNSFTIGQDKKLEKLNEGTISLICNDYDSPYDDLLLKTGKRICYM